MNRENEHDFTKLMLETLRAKSSEHKRMIRENEGDAGTGFGGFAQETDTASVESSIEDKEEVPGTEENPTEESNGLDTAEGKEEAEKVSDMVDKLVTLKTFKIYPESSNVVMSGIIQTTDIEWQFSKDDGFFINANNVEFTQKVREIIDGLSRYFENWQDKWAEQIGEYTKED